MDLLEVYKIIAPSTGFLSLFYLIYKDFILTPRVVGKPLALCRGYKTTTTSTLEFDPEQGKLVGKNIQGIPYFLKISLTVTNKNFLFKKIKVFVKYSKNDCWHEATILWKKDIEFELATNDRYKVRKEIFDSPNQNNIDCLAALEKDKIVIGYIMFIKEKECITSLREEHLYNLPEVKLEFIGYSGMIKKTIKFEKQELSSESLADEYILEQVTD